MKNGVVALSEDLFFELLKKGFEVPEDIHIIGAEYDGFRRVLKVSCISNTENFVILPEGATIPVISLKPKILRKKK